MYVCMYFPGARMLGGFLLNYVITGSHQLLLLSFLFIHVPESIRLLDCTGSSVTFHKNSYSFLKCCQNELPVVTSA